MILVIVSGLPIACGESMNDTMEPDSDQLIGFVPEYIFGYYDYGLVMTEVIPLEQAIKIFDEGIRLIPGQSWPATEAEIMGAIEQYTTEIKTDPHDANSYLWQGHAYYRLGQLELAIEDYNGVINLITNHADAYYVRGNSYREIGLIEKAIEDYNKVVQHLPGYSFAYYARAMAYVELGQTTEAIADLEEFIALVEIPEWTETVKQWIDNIR